MLAKVVVAHLWIACQHQHLRSPFQVAHPYTLFDQVVLVAFQLGLEPVALRLDLFVHLLFPGEIGESIWVSGSNLANCRYRSVVTANISALLCLGNSKFEGFGTQQCRGSANK